MSASLRTRLAKACHSIAHPKVVQNIHHICWALGENLEDVRVHHPVRGKEPFHSRRRSRRSPDEELVALPVTLPAVGLPEASEASHEVWFIGIAVKTSVEHGVKRQNQKI